MTPHPNRNKKNKAKRKAPKAKAVAGISAAAATPRSPRHNHDLDYSALLSSVMASFRRAVSADLPVFQTDAEGLNELYLDSLPAERQVHNCNCCARFIKNYGGLVAINEEGRIAPLMWNPHGVPTFYRGAFTALYARVMRSRVVSVFHTTETVWGQPITPPWSHMAVTPLPNLIYDGLALTAEQAMAVSKENYKTVAAALNEFTVPMLDKALQLLRSESLQRSEKFIGPVQWLRDLQDRPRGRIGENLLWRAIGTAPEGFCHPRASVIGTLLEDIQAGYGLVDIRKRFHAKIGGAVYQRPQAAPAAGTIRSAEALVERLGLAPAFERRYARFEELQVAWVPRGPAAEPSPSGAGLFGKVRPKGLQPAPAMNLPAITMTWEKFRRVVLPDAVRLQINVPAHGNFMGLTSAVHRHAPPILKWDHEGERNPVAWYVYVNGSHASQWGLSTGWTNIRAVSDLPNLWGSNPMPFVTQGAVLVIEGAADSRRESGNMLFPECLRDDLHGVRSVVEAYSKTATLGGRDRAVAGYDVRKGFKTLPALRALINNGWVQYQLDRWD